MRIDFQKKKSWFSLAIIFRIAQFDFPKKQGMI
jgi:hypothetical protein